MTIKNNQLEDAARALTEDGGIPPTGTNKGAFYTKDIAGITEGFYVDDQGRQIQLTDDGAAIGGGGGGGGPSTTDDLPEGQVNLYYTDVRVSANGDVIAGASHAASPHAPTDAQKNSDILIGEIEAVLIGTITSHTHPGGGTDVLVTISAADTTAGRLEDKLQAGANITINKLNSGENEVLEIVAASGGAVSEFSFNLAAGATMQDRITGASNVPAGWVLAPASTAGITQLGTLAETLTIDHGVTDLALISVFEETTSGPASLQGITKIDLSAQGDQKNTISLNECGVIDLQTKTNTSKSLTVFVKFID